jgi:peptidoglycan/LPS O-acetylase OafA/YrhL
VPLLVLVTGMRRWPRVARVVLFSAALASCLAWSAMGQPIDLRMTMFLPGILLYEAVSSGALKAKLGPKGEVLSGVVFAVCVTLTYVLKQAILEGRQAAAKDPLQTVMVVPSYSRVAVLGVGCFLLALYCFQTRGPIVRFFSWRPMRYLGNISYSYYLIHGITLNAASVVAGKVVKNGAAGGIGMTALMLLGFAATFVSSTILFGIVEKPISLEGKSVGQVVRDLAGKLRAAPSSRAA